jgi:MFS family permease
MGSRWALVRGVYGAAAGLPAAGDASLGGSRPPPVWGAGRVLGNSLCRCMARLDGRLRSRGSAPGRPLLYHHWRGRPSTTIGGVVALANTATVAAAWAGRWSRATHFVLPLTVGILVTGLGVAVFGVTTEVVGLAAVALVISGLGMGLLQTIGPAVAADSVHEDERAEAIAAVGLYRASATFLAPFGVATLVLLMPLSYALVAVGGVMALPATYTMRARRR